MYGQTHTRDGHTHKHTPHEGISRACKTSRGKKESNEPSYNNTVISTLAVDGWAVTFGTVRRGLGGAAARPCPFSLYQI